ncbi:putative cytochrome b-c1 complex subunit 7 [Helianthus annuus]|nr:putative cytochrome b-c1 complex subunit 7 [Helianthus annuus]
MATSKLVRTILDPNKNWFAALHKKTISDRLTKYGQYLYVLITSRSIILLKRLRYDDLYDPMECLDIKEALNRLPREIVDARNQRLLRAMDLSMKHEYLPKDLQAQQTPFRSYLSDMLALVSS